MAAAIYNFTEAAVKVVHPVWIALLLGVSGIPWRLTSEAVSISRLEQPESPTWSAPRRDAGVPTYPALPPELRKTAWFQRR
jgi:hypothetical protein